MEYPENVPFRNVKESFIITGLLGKCRLVVNIGGEADRMVVH
jgi:hypothetical protein